MLFYQLKNPVPFKDEGLKSIDLSRFRADLFFHQVHDSNNEDMRIAHQMIACFMLAKGEKILKMDSVNISVFKKRLSDILSEQLGPIKRQDNLKVEEFLKETVVNGEVDPDMDSTLGRAFALHQTLKLSSYWSEQVARTEYSEEELARLVTGNLIKKWDSIKFVEKCSFNHEFLRKHTDASVEDILVTESERVRSCKHLAKVKAEMTSLEYLERVVKEEYVEATLLLMKGLLGVEMEKGEVIRGLVQALGASGIKQIITEEFIIQPIQRTLISAICMIYLHTNITFKQEIRKTQTLKLKTIMGWIRGTENPSRDLGLWRGPYLLRRVSKGVDEKKEKHVQKNVPQKEGKKLLVEINEDEEEVPAKRVKNDQIDKQNGLDVQEIKKNVAVTNAGAEFQNYNNRGKRGSRGFNSNRSRGRARGARGSGRGFFQHPHHFGQYPFFY